MITKRILITIFLSLTFTFSAYAEYVFLKDGSIIEGSITSDSASSVNVFTKDKKSKTIPRGSIMRILYTELYMGKIYVQKIDGRNVICFMVDEDRDTYTFREELFSPKEFKLRRDEVLFMARGNPTGLSGEPETDRIALKWFAPYNPVKRYRVYIKGPEDKKFSVAGETGGKEISINELKSNTKYYFTVTAIDASGDESVASNELAISTKNLPPEKPEITGVETLAAGGYRFEWSEAIDSDGKVAGYRIYRKEDSGMKLVAETKKRIYAVPKNENIEKIYLSAVDDLKGESGFIRVYNPYKQKKRFNFAPGFLYPSGKLKDIAEYGYGLGIEITFSNHLLPQLELGVEFSSYYLTDKENFTESESSINSIIFFPVMFSAGYAFYPVDELAIIPEISAGMVTVYYDYNYFNIVTSKNTGVSEVESNPALGGGLAIRYDLNESVSLNFSLNYIIFFEESGSFNYYTISCGAGYRFGKAE